MTTAVTVTAQTLPEEAFATLVSLPTTTNISRFLKTFIKTNQTPCQDARGFQSSISLQFNQAKRLRFSALQAAKATISVMTKPLGFDLHQRATLKMMGYVDIISKPGQKLSGALIRGDIEAEKEKEI